ncbi:MAG: hypothetical protein HOV80_11055 [Polyangiaceae bacterium]|nr:hypothetical protein [Polyangiaceae bacterium]
MTRDPNHLGDCHNFGRRVSLRDGFVAKPRTLLWEWLLLAPESPLRAKLEEVGPDMFDFLPSLRFTTHDARAGGEVERADLSPLSPTIDATSLAHVTGRAIALYTWLGLSDLHWENLVLGEREGRIVLGPLDVEMILDDLELPTQTKLLPEADEDIVDVCRHACGVRRVLPFLGKPIGAEALVAMVAGYRRALGLLDRNAPAIASIFESLPGLADAPIRVLLRGTDEYVRAKAEEVWPPLLDAEQEQLARGDIPYFFRLYGRSEIRYFSEPSLTESRALPLEGDVPQLEPLLDVSKKLRSPRRKSLREQGLFALIGAFDHRTLKGRYTYEDVAITFRGKTLIAELGRDELETERDLGRFVASVYLPCTCGETRAVFVPPVTMCNAPSRGARRL